ncbi:MAG TPA: threonine/serine dehydratase [Gemmatimonadaceae bacterium]|nr:threonine/serine dehydratase [Gemmatimonadaceae bacterium]
MITKDDIQQAHERIRGQIHRTPLLTSVRLGAKAGELTLYFKCECFQRTGSFKARGALNAMLQLTSAERTRGVVTVSAGNHAQAVAWAASRVGADCITVMPEGASPTKVAATEGYGGTVHIEPGERKRAFERAEAIAAEGRVMVHPFEDERVAAGQGTVALELLEQWPEVEAVVVPIGGGGLISGMATAIKAARPDVKVIGVEPVGAPTMRASLDAGAPQNIATKTVADGLAAPMVGAMTLRTVQEHVDDVVLVTDDEIVAAMKDILSYSKLVVEPAGAAAFAALAADKAGLAAGSRVVAVISGGNVDLQRLKELL